MDKQRISPSFVERQISFQGHKEEDGGEETDYVHHHSIAMVSSQDFRVLFQLAKKKINVICYYIIIVFYIVVFVLLHDYKIQLYYYIITM